MMASKWGGYARALTRGLRLRCPVCGQGKIDESLFKIRKTCPNCGVRFERDDGESVGAMYFNLGIAELTSIGGFFLFNALFHPPFWPHLLFWVTYNILFCILFYRHSRGLWIAINHLTGGVYRDQEREKEQQEEVLSPFQPRKRPTVENRTVENRTVENRTVENREREG